MHGTCKTTSAKTQVRLHGSRGVSSLATDPPGTPVTPCSIRKGEERRKKKEKFYIYLDVTHTHTIFHTKLCHTLSFTHNFHTHHLSHTTLSHTHHLSLSHTIFHIQLCHTQLCFTSGSSTTSFVFPSFPVPATTTFGAHYWKKLPCGAIRSFNFCTALRSQRRQGKAL